MVSRLFNWPKAILSRLIDFWRNETVQRGHKVFLLMLTGKFIYIFRLVANPLINRPVMSMNGADNVLIVVLVNGRNKRLGTNWSSYFSDRSSMARKSWAYLIPLLRVEIVIDVALDNTILLLGVFTIFIRFAHLLKITSLDFDVLQATCLL